MKTPPRLLNVPYERNCIEVHAQRSDGAWQIISGKPKTEAEALTLIRQERESFNALRGFIDQGPRPVYRLVRVLAKCEVIKTDL